MAMAMVQVCAIALLLLLANQIRKVLSRGKYQAASRISWKV
jgi:hypothetical protein